MLFLVYFVNFPNIHIFLHSCVSSYSCGFAIENEDDTFTEHDGNKRSLKCGTEKAKHQSKNHRTAGKN